MSETIIINSKDLSNIIYSLFNGDCECSMACYKHCNDRDENGHSINCSDAIEKTLLEYLKEQDEKTKTAQRIYNTFLRGSYK